MEHSIEEFSSIFGFGHSTISSTEEDDLCFKINMCRELKYDSIFEAVEILGLKHQEHFFDSVLDIYNNREILLSKKKFMSFVLARCMKLSETPTFFNFLVVCTYIDNLISCICNNMECFRVVTIASKCVTAAFRRRYVDVFDRENGFEGFSNYCEKLNRTVLNPSGEDSETDSEDSFDLEGFIPPDTDEVTTLLRDSKRVRTSNFLLNEFEKKLLYDRDEIPLVIDPAEDIFIPVGDGSDSTKDQELDLAFKNLNIKSEKVLERIKEHCPTCEDNCYKDVVSVAKELEVCEI